MTRIHLKKTALLLCVLLAATLISPFGSLAADDDVTVLRVCSWEEYIDEGDWDDDEVIDLESGDIFGENHMVKDFEDWYYDTYHKKVRVEYSTFGTNEDLYNMLTLGDVFDLVCPSEYMIMKLMAEDKLSPLSEEFFDESNENNYYIKGVSPYIRHMFETHEINGNTWDQYAAGFMWGVTGFVYNPKVVSREDASTWHLIDNTSYKRQITIKDNVRDTYFAALGALKSDLLTSESFKSSPDYLSRLQDEMNDTSPEMIAKVQDYLQSIKDNLYSFETDSGKTDMITGKIVANLQWSGDAVYSLNQAEGNGTILEFAVPAESTNVYFDGWVKLKSGVENDPDKQHAAEAFINFLSRPDNAIRNMAYIGYTSVISNSEDGRVFEYVKWNYGANEDDKDTVEYPVGHFFSDDKESQDKFILTVPKDHLRRQLSAQYPSEEVLGRASIMVYFNKEVTEATNQMWINIRCFNIKNVPVWCWILAGLIVVLIAYAVIYKKISRKHQISTPDITTYRKHERKN